MQFVSAYEAKTSCYQVVIDSATCIRNTQDQFVFVNNIAIHNIIYDGDRKYIQTDYSNSFSNIVEASDHMKYVYTWPQVLT